MGTCRSTCASSAELEYYDVWRKDPPMRGARRHPALVMNRASPPLEAKATRPTRRNTKLWVCDRGCCSIRWKLDYAEFQSYSKYAEISPYVVVQENNESCTCVICNGLSEQFMQCRLDQLHTRLRVTTPSPSETDDEDLLDTSEVDELVGRPPVRPFSSPVA